jgi:hypothetical protein
MVVHFKKQNAHSSGHFAFCNAHLSGHFVFCNGHSSGYFAFCNVLKEWGVPQIKQLPEVPEVLILGTPHSEDITLSFKLQGGDQ